MKEREGEKPRAVCWTVSADVKSLLFCSLFFGLLALCLPVPECLRVWVLGDFSGECYSHRYHEETSQLTVDYHHSVPQYIFNRVKNPEISYHCPDLTLFSCQSWSPC